MKLFRPSWMMLLPIAVYLAAVLIVGCGGGGGGGSSSSGLTGGTTGGGSTGGSSGGSSGGTTGGTTGGGSTTGGTTTGGTTGGTTGSTGGSDSGAVYFLSDKDGGLSIYQINVDGTGVAPVSGQTDVGGPCVSWDGTSIAYEKWSLYADVFQMSSDGSDPALIYEPGLDCLNPCLSPDGLTVIFSMSNGGVPQLFRTTVTGVGLTQLTNEIDGVSWGRFSPDGTRIVLATNSGNVDVKIMDADGNNVQTLASGTAIQDMPMFNPDGDSVVYIENFGSDFNPNYQVMKVDAGGGTPVRITSSNEDDRSPCFSEDGAFILFTRKMGATREIYRVAAAGGTAAQVSSFGSWTGWLSAKKR